MAQQPRVSRVGDSLELVAVPALEQQDLPVGAGQGTAGHQ